MGNLTNDMRRLCNEILTARHARQTMVKDLARGARDMKNSVSAMLAGFSNAHAEMARKAKAERMAFESGLKHTVADMRMEYASDLAGARRAWFGKG